MKIDANNAATYLRHCKNLAIVTGKPENEGRQIYAALRRLELKLHKLQLIQFERPLNANEQKQEEKLTEKVNNMLLPKYRNQFFVNGDARGYALKFNTEEAENDKGGKKKYSPLPEGFYKDWGYFGILAPNF